MKDIPIENIYIADFETRAGDRAIQDNQTWVWAWAITKMADFENPVTGSTMERCFRWLEDTVYYTGNIIVYYHNLKFDGNFIISWLLMHGFKHTTERYVRKNEFKTLISDEGTFYSITVGIMNKGQIEFRDSYKKLPFTVEKIAKDFNTKYKKLDIDYVEDREEGYIMTEEEKEYVKNDVRIVAEALKHLYDAGDTGMTIGSDSLNYYINMLGGKDKFRKPFPILSSDEDAFVRKSYKGAWCYVKNPGIHCTNGKGLTFDVNSLYPSMMHSVSGNMFPYGKGTYFEGKYEFDPVQPLYVAHFEAAFELKEGYLPTVQLKGNFNFRENEYVVDSEGMQELYMTCVDLEVFFEHYDIYSIKWIDGYKYCAGKGFFDKYIDHFMEQKKKEKGAKRAIAKLHLNNLYGKFAAKIEGANKVPSLDDMGVVKYSVTEPEHRKPVYIPVGSFITAYARRFTIKAAQANYNSFQYADTDSIHVFFPDGEAEAIYGVTEDAKELCCWKCESTWDEAVFVRQKTYAEHNVEEDREACEPFWNLKCAGMDGDSKSVFLDEVVAGTRPITDFKPGLVIEGHKLKPKTVRGGVILVPIKFTLKDM